MLGVQWKVNNKNSVNISKNISLVIRDNTVNIYYFSFAFFHILS